MTRLDLRDPAPTDWKVSPGQALILGADTSVSEELAAIVSRLAGPIRVIRLPPESADEHLPALTGQRVSLCFLEVGSNPGQALPLLARMAAPPQSLPVVAILLQPEPDLALSCMRQGACGCMVRPFSDDQMRPILRRAQRMTAEKQPEPWGRIICIAPAKGSCGASILALNLAWQASRAGSERVLLADLDPIAGSLAFYLKLKSTHSFVDALRHAGRMDPDLWRGLIVPTRDFDAILAPEEPFGCEVEPPALAAVLSFAKRSYGTVILDSGGPRGGLGVELARLCDQLILVTTPELAAIHGARRWLSHLSVSGVARSKMRLVMNRWTRDLGAGPQEVSRALGLEVSAVLPEDPLPIHAAIVEGRPVSPGSTYGKKVRELYDILAAENTSLRRPPARRGLLSVLTGR